MKNFNQYLFMGLSSMFALNTVQANTFSEVNTYGDSQFQANTADAAAFNAPSTIQHISANQNRRLLMTEGLSLDSYLPTMRFDQGVSIHGFTRLNSQEQQLGLGLQFGDSHLNIMTGKGIGFSRLANQYASLDPYYFHGGTHAEFKFNAIELAHQIGTNAALQFGKAIVKADNLEDRNTQYIGGQYKGAHAHIMQIERGGASAGQALSLGFDTMRGGLNWSALRHAAGGEIQTLSYAYQPNARIQYHIEASSQHNPLIEQTEQSRIMIGFSRALGGAYRMGAEQSEAEAKPARSRYVVLGGIAVGAAVALSSGSDGQDSNFRVADQHAAARQVLNQINPTSVRQNREYGGWIYRTPDNRYTSTTPIKGEIASINLPLTLIPAGGQALASYHTHGGNDPAYVNEQFSPTDIASDQFTKVDGYLGTPAGSMLWHNHRTSRVMNLGRIAN